MNGSAPGVFNKINGIFFQIPRGHIWIEGDNKGVSVDSRQYGPVPYALIKNRLMFRVSYCAHYPYCTQEGQNCIQFWPF